MKKIQRLVAALMLLTLAFTLACNKPDDPNNGGNGGGGENDNVRVTTYTPQDVTQTTATLGGDVIATPGLTLTELGVCWGEDRNPTVNDMHLSTTNWSEPFTYTVTGLEPGTSYHVRAYAFRGLEYYYGADKSFTTDAGGGVGNGIYNGHAYVDLGLPSGTLWATCNVGAKKPEEYGDYFAWGETEAKEKYNWSTYKYCNGYYNTLTKYCNMSYYGYNGFSDNLTSLEPSDDAATANWGDGWCMPTMDQWNELVDNTGSRWATQNGVYGRFFTALNGNSLFLPAAGSYYEGSELHGQGDWCNYWSTALCTSLPECACGFPSIADRCNGWPIRPVRSLRRK